MPKFSIKVKPMFGDEFRDSGVVHDIVYHTWSREASVAYNNMLEAPEVDGRPTPVKMEITYSSPLLMTEEAKVYYGVTKIGRTSVTYETQINESVSGRPVATMTMVAVMAANVIQPPNRARGISSERRTSVTEMNACGPVSRRTWWRASM